MQANHSPSAAICPEGSFGTGSISERLITWPNSIRPDLIQKSVKLILCLAVLMGLLAQSLRAALLPTELPGLIYTNAFFPEAVYRTNVPSPDQLLGFPLAQRAATAVEIERCLQAWTNAAPDRTRLVEYARSHENRPLHYLVVTSPENMKRITEIQEGMARLADPRRLSDAEAKKLIDTLPPVAWLAYTIHGDETEGSDAALSVLYYLVASTDAAVTRLLSELVIIVDPLMNPDGRDRFLKMVAEHRGAMPNVDDQSLLHDGYWPAGRGNHYLYDLNRDYIHGVHPETRGRISEIAHWNPVLFVDAHGMGSQDTHLFSPPREPINPNMPSVRMRWAPLFAKEQAAAFDRQQLVYYTGEWNDEWYPGYSDAWASFRGAVGILYEQARIADDGVRRPEGRILSYRESVRHHVLGSMANLETLRANARSILDSFYQARKTALDENGPYAARTYAILPAANRYRIDRFLDLMRLQGFEVYQAEKEFTAPFATNQLGMEVRSQNFPAGTLLIPNRQPLAHLLAAMLEFDPRLSSQALVEERTDLLRDGSSRIYDTTAWNLTMLYGLESFTLAMEVPETAKPLSAASATTHTHDLSGRQTNYVAFVINGEDDRSVTVAARLMERDVQVRVSSKAFHLDNRPFARGSVVVTALDNRTFAGNLQETIKRTATETGLEAIAIGEGLGEGDLPDLGGSHFARLQRPRIALLSRGRINPNDFGSIWHTLDKEIGIRHSHIGEADGADWARYNVIVVPDGGGSMSTGLMNNFKEWTKAGGTLVVINDSLRPLVTEKAEFSKVRLLPDVLARLADYELAVTREWMARMSNMPPADAIWTHRATTALSYPWETANGDFPDEKELKRRDAWQAIFMPQGAILASRVDTKHWLTFGTGELLPVLVAQQPILMTTNNVETPVRLGHFISVPAKSEDFKTNSTILLAQHNSENQADQEEETSPKENQAEKKKEHPRIGWAAAPEGYEMRLRMSGLLWPEAVHRVANAAYVTREGFGRGQIILFAFPPTFRSCSPATIRLFANAAIYGPGLGATHSIMP